MNTQHYKTLAAFAALTLVACSASAQTYTVKFGGGYIDPHATSSDLQGTLPHIPNGFSNTVPSGSTLEVQSKTAALFSIARSFGDNWEAELLLGIPPKHDVKLRVSDSIKSQTGSANPVTAAVAANFVKYDGQVVATVKTIAPTIFVNYKFLEATNPWRPYVGAGLNYTHFKAKSTAAGNAFYTDGGVNIKLTDSYGLALQAGINYKLDQHWSLNAGVSSTMIKNDLTITTDNSRQTGKYDFQPLVYSLMVGYSF